MDSFISIYPQQGQSGVTNLQVTVGNWTGSTQRTGSFLVTASKYGYTSSVTVNVQQQPEAHILSVSPNLVDFAASGGSDSVQVSASHPWTATSSDGFISVSPSAGTAGTSNILITAQDNSGTARTGTVVISDGVSSTTVDVSQAAFYEFSVTPLSISFDLEGGTEFVTVNSSLPWSASTNSGLLTLSSSTGGTGTSVLTIFSNSAVSTADTAVITITNGVEIYMVSVSYASVVYSTKYFTMRSLSDNNTFRYPKNGVGWTANMVSLYYSLDDGETWNEAPGNGWNSGYTRQPCVISGLSYGDTVIWKANCGDSAYGQIFLPSNGFGANGDFEAYGNMLSLAYMDDFQNKSGLNTPISNLFAGQPIVHSRNLLFNGSDHNSIRVNTFKGCTKLIDAPKYMDFIDEACFSGCTSLVVPPTTIYLSVNMFEACTSLTGITFSDGSYVDSAFKGCTSLVSVPEITNLAGPSMFEGCTSLVYGMGFSGTSYGKSKNSIYKGCTSLVEAPVMKLGVPLNYSSHFTSMFEGCTSLVSADKIDEIVLEGNNTQYACKNMFKGCTSLVNAPKITINSIDDYVCQSMFEGCTSLVSASAVTLGHNSVGDAYGYSALTSMFAGCTRLAEAPIINMITYDSATTGTYYRRLPYSYMFQGCSSLNRIVVNIPMPKNKNTGWVEGVAANGEFVQLSGASDWVVDGTNAIPEGWVVKNYNLSVSPQSETLAYSGGTTSVTISSEQPWTATTNDNWLSVSPSTGNSGTRSLLITAIGNSGETRNGTVTISDGILSKNISIIQQPTYFGQYLTFVPSEATTFSISGSSVSYSLDNGTTWATLNNGSSTPTVITGNKILWKSLGTIGNNAYFISNGHFVVEGNAMSLLYGDNFAGNTDLSNMQNALRALFLNCTGLTSAENMILPATSLTGYCYRSMFQGCSSLEKAPKLPATTLAEQCYYNMFSGCISLTTAPELPANTLVASCYQYMFNGCSSLNYVKCLASSGLNSSYCANNWLNGAASSGTFVKNPSAQVNGTSGISWYRGVSGIPSGWMVVDAT